MDMFIFFTVSRVAVSGQVSVCCVVYVMKYSLFHVAWLSCVVVVV